jgi:hypothetical protein
MTPARIGRQHVTAADCGAQWAVQTDPGVTVLDFVAGELRVTGWPAAGPRPPFGLRDAGGSLRGPARLRAAVLQTLRAAGCTCEDLVEHTPLPGCLAPAVPDPPSGILSAWLGAGRRGVACGICPAQRHAFVHAACAALRQRALVVVPDTAVGQLWRTALRERGLEVCLYQPEPAVPVQILTAAAAARAIGWLGRRHELLCVEMPELMPAPQLGAILDGSAATARVGFAGDTRARDLFAWTAGLGPVFAVAAPANAPACIELRLALPPAARARYDAGWHAFLAAYDRFACAQPGAGFHRFVQFARSDPVARPGLLGWHQALRAAAWNEAKADAVAELLQRHRGARILVFTPDRQSAYQLAREHLIAPVTAELPLRERSAAVAAFVAGTLRVLAGPRLLDAGVPERSAEFGIVAGGGFSEAQRRARGRRVAERGTIYELVGLDTVEVGRGARWRGTAAAATAVVHGG